MKRVSLISVILMLMVSFMSIPTFASGEVISWNAQSDDAVYKDGIDTGYDWYFYNNGSAEYNVDIPVDGVYSMKITKHNIEGNSVFTVVTAGETLTKNWSTDDAKENFVISDSIYLNKGSQKLKFKTSQGGAVSGFELTLQREETRVYKSVREWTEQPNGSDNGDNWYFYNDTEVTYDFAAPKNGKYKVLLSYSNAPVNSTSYITYLGREYPCTPGLGEGINQSKEILSDIILYKFDGKITISGFGGCTISGITIVLTETVDNIELTATGLAEVSAGTVGDGNIENIIDYNTGSSYIYNLNPSMTEATMEDFWIQVNLDAPHKISQIRYLHDVNQGTWDHFTKYISFRLSNDPEFKTYTEITYSDIIPNDGQYFTLPVNENEAYRYIRLQKTDSYNFALACAELEVWGAEEKGNTEMYTISEPQYSVDRKDDGGFEENAIASVSVEVQNNVSQDKSILLCVVQYSGNQLIKVDVDNVSLSEVGLINLHSEINIENKPNTKIRVYIWDNDLVPLKSLDI